MLGQQEQDTAEVVDPAAEQKMVQNVLDALLQDEEPVKPQVSHRQALPPCPAPFMFAMPSKHHAPPQQLAHTADFITYFQHNAYKLNLCGRVLPLQLVPAAFVA